MSGLAGARQGLNGMRRQGAVGVDDRGRVHPERDAVVNETFTFPSLTCAAGIDRISWMSGTYGLRRRSKGAWVVVGFTPLKGAGT